MWSFGKISAIVSWDKDHLHWLVDLAVLSTTKFFSAFRIRSTERCEMILGVSFLREVLWGLLSSFSRTLSLVFFYLRAPCIRNIFEVTSFSKSCHNFTNGWITDASIQIFWWDEQSGQRIKNLHQDNFLADSDEVARKLDLHILSGIIWAEKKNKTSVSNEEDIVKTKT